MKRMAVDRWWQLIGTIVRLAVARGAWPSSREIAHDVRLTRRNVLKYLADMKADGLVVSIGGPEGGWMVTGDGARWREVEIPRVSVDAVPRKIRSKPWLLRKHRKLEKMRALRTAAAVLDRDGVEEIEF